MQTLVDSLRHSLAARYAIERELGRGGMATVYLALDRRHNRRVALKILDASIAGSLGVERFLREIEIAARLTHPHIVPLYDSGQAADVVYYVMPYIAGETLRQRVRRDGALPFADVARLTREIASALDYAHREGVVHRDIKPENILVSDMHAVVADFGIARAIAEATTSGTLTQAGIAMGTPMYMSPEQIDGNTTLDGRSDQYSLACVVYELLAGHAPFAGGTAMALMAQQLTADPPPLRTTEPVAESVEQALRRALSKAPGDRFESVADFAAALVLTGMEPTQAVARLPARSSGRTGSRLPSPLTPLIGRERDVQGIVALLQQSGARLLTLHGPGGIGKSRLAIEASARVAGAFHDGVWFVALAEVRDAESMRVRIAQALGLRGVAASAAALHDALRDREALLLLDNFEQLIAAATDVSGLLAQCPRVKALVTSQLVLHVYGEHEFRVEPLPIPERHEGKPAIAMESPAVQLFVQRATAARPDFALTADNVEAVVEICSALDGVPLAIELAAARVRAMAPQALLPKLRHALDVLTGGARDLPERQRTMRGAIAWCHDLLTAEERAVFRRLAVFAGSASVAGVAAVCRDEESDDTEELLLSLVDKSLLREQIDAVGELRFVMLKPIQAFAAEMLDAATEREDTADAHAAYFRSFALQGEAAAARGDESWLDRLEADHDNLGVALARLLERGMPADALRATVALWRYWEARSYAREGLDLLRAAIAQAPQDLPTSLRLAALYAAGVLADACGDYAEGRRLLEQHLELTEHTGDKHAVSISRNNLAVLLLRQGAVDDAIPMFETASAMMREVGNVQASAMGLMNVGNAERMRKNFAAARQRYEQARRSFAEIGDRVNVAWSFSHLGDLARDEGNPTDARARYRESVAIFADLKHKRGLANVLTDLGELLAAHGELLEARGLLEEALVHAAEIGDQRAMIRVFEADASVAAISEQDARAVCLAGAISGLRERLGAPLSDSERARLESRVLESVRRLGAAECERIWSEGNAMSIEAVLRFVTAPTTV